MKQIQHRKNKCASCDSAVQVRLVDGKVQAHCPYCGRTTGMHDSLSNLQQDFDEEGWSEEKA